MNDFDNCSAEELDALDKLSNGEPSSSIPSEIIDSLAQKYLLEDYQGTYIVPALVWDRFKKYLQENTIS
jgi:hypothetical protein